MNLLESMISHETFTRRESEYVRWYPKGLEPILTSEDIGPNGGSIGGVYIHVPFCDELCTFCPFNKTLTESSLVLKFVEAVCAEIEIYSASIESETLRFVYFGGGTPSVLKTSQLEKILSTLDRCFGITNDTEITLETHPKHLNKGFLTSRIAEGVNRISCGIQSTSERVLTAIGARHTADDTIGALDTLGHGIDNWGVDILFRCPDQPIDQLLEDLDTVSRAGTKHVSCYSLVAFSEAKLPSVETEAELTIGLHTWLEEHRFSHYASCASGGFDFSLTGYESRYEVDHWSAPQINYLGLGPGALGFVGNRVTVNGLNIERYVTKLLNDRSLYIASNREVELTELQRRYFVLGVKTLKVSFREFEQKFGVKPQILFASEFDTLKLWGFADVSTEQLVLTPLGRLNVDLISTLFFSKSEKKVIHPEEPQIRAAERTMLKNLHVNNGVVINA